MGGRQGLEGDIAGALDSLKPSGRARVFCHRDADGLAGAAIITHLLEKLGIDCRASSHLPDSLTRLRPSSDLNVFVDLGSGQLDRLRGRFADRPTLILDHHPPQGDAWEGLVHVNPHLHGLDGSTEISGSGLAYLLDREATGSAEMSKIAVVGAIADRQDFLGELKGLNGGILTEATRAGLVREVKDVLLFGRESRPLHLALKSFQDPPIPGVSGSEAGSAQLLEELGIPLRDDGHLRTLGDLSAAERRVLATELVVRCITKVSPEVARFVPSLVIGSVYRLVGEDAPLQYASEYGTCINSAARMGLTEEAIRMMLGDRSRAFDLVIAGLKGYRKMLSMEVRSVMTTGLENTREGLVQYFISDTTPRNIIGPVTGIVLGSGIADPYRPLVGMVRGYRTKVSARCSKLLVLGGIDLSAAVGSAANQVGGEGGGHRGAAGAHFRAGREPEFLGALEKALSQCTSTSPLISAPS
jgi:single-stranded-DNA-specific exonuclease